MKKRILVVDKKKNKKHKKRKKDGILFTRIYT